jgi:hypothetical protein
VFKVLGSVHRNDLPVIDNGDAVAQLIGLVHVVRGQDHRDLLFSIELLYVFPDMTPGLGVKFSLPVRLSSLLPRELVLAAFKTRDLSWLKVHWRAVSRSICLPLV